MDSQVTISADSLAALMRKCQSLGWEVARGYHDDESAAAQRDRLFREFTGQMPVGAL